MQFTLHITLGNAEMKDENDIAWALGQVAKQVRQHRLSDEAGPNSFPIYDANGERVGRWTATETD